MPSVDAASLNPNNADLFHPGVDRPQPLPIVAAPVKELPAVEEGSKKTEPEQPGVKPELDQASAEAKPPASTPEHPAVESETTRQSREANSKSINKYGEIISREYDATMAKAVSDRIIVMGYEGTEATRTTKQSIPNVEEVKLKMETTGFAMGAVSEIIMDHTDPELKKDWAQFDEEKSTLSPEDAANRMKDLLTRQAATVSRIYKALRGDAEDLKDPLVQSTRAKLDELKKLKTAGEIIRQADNPQLLAAYESWMNEHKVEPFRPENLDEVVFDDIAAELARVAEKASNFTLIEDEAPILKPVLSDVPAIKSLSTSLVSVFGDVGGERTKTDVFGNDVEYEEEAREAIEVGVERTAALAETEKRSKWGAKRKEGQSWLSYAGEVVKNNLDRGWRAMFSDKMHHAKEVRHGLRMMAEAGVETGLTAEFVSQVDAEARKRLAASREKLSKFGRFKAKARDFFSEVVGSERDLHTVKEEVIRDWRKKFDENPFDAKDSPIYDLVMSDLQSRTEIARRVAESTQETLHLSGEDKSKQTIKIESGSKYGQFLNEQIFRAAVAEALARKKAGEGVTGLSPKLRVELDQKLKDYYQTDEFKQWKDSLSADEQALLPDSFTYASDILAQVEGSLIPNALELSDYYDKAQKLEIDIDLTIGKAQYGPNGEITPESAGRVKLKKEVLAKMHERPAVFTQEDMGGGITRAMFMAKADQLVNNPLGAAVVGFFAGRFIATGAKALGGAVGVGVLGGVKAGFREWAKLGAEMQQIDIEKAIGLRRAEDAKKYHKLEAFSNQSVVMSDHAESIDATIAKLTGEGSQPTPDGVTDLMALIVNGEARVSLGVRRKINLIGAKSVGGGESAERQNYQLERRKFDLAQARARVELKKIAESSPEVWDTVRKELGFRKGTSIDTILRELRLTQEDNLLDGSEIPEAYESVLGGITLEQQDSVKGKAELFKRFRLASSVKQGALVGVTAGLMTWGLGEFAEHREVVVATNNEPVLATVVSPDAPLHSDGLLNGVGEIEGMTIHAKVPEGMTLVPLQGSTLADGHHTFNLMVDGQNEPYLTNLKFDSEGMPVISPALQAQLTSHGVTITPQPLASHLVETVSSGAEAVKPETFTIRMGDLEGRDQGGIWDWMMNSVRGENPDVGINVQTNGAYKLFRAYENMRGNDNFEIQTEPGIPHRVIHTVTTNWDGKTMEEVLPAVNPDNMIIKDLPALFATPEGHQQIADVVAEAARQQAAGQPLDRFHQLVYTAATSGESGIPSAKDMAFIMEQFDARMIPETPLQLVNTHEVFIEVTKPITQEAACIVEREVVEAGGTGLPLIVDWHRPLEAAEGTRAPRASTYESTIPASSVEPASLKPGKKAKKDEEGGENPAGKEPKPNPTGKEHNETDLPLPEREITEREKDNKPKRTRKDGVKQPVELNENEVTTKARKKKKSEISPANNPGKNTAEGGKKQNKKPTGKAKDKGRGTGTGNEEVASTLPTEEVAVEEDNQSKNKKKNKRKVKGELPPTTDQLESRTKTKKLTVEDNDQAKKDGKEGQKDQTTRKTGPTDDGNGPGKNPQTKNRKPAPNQPEQPVGNEDIKDEDLFENTPKGRRVRTKPTVNPNEDLPPEVHNEKKKRLKKNLTVEDFDTTAPTPELDVAEVKNQIIENKNLADFALLEYGAIARAINELSDKEVASIMKAMENRPDLQAVYRAAMIGLRVMPQDFAHTTEQYEARIEGTKKRISQLNESIERESKRRKVSIFEPQFATEFNGKITWDKTKSLDELPDFAEGTLVLPENVVVDKEKINAIAESVLAELRAMNDEEAGVDVDNLRPLREEIHRLEQEAMAEGILRIVDGKREKNARSGSRKAGDRALLRKIDDKIKLLSKIEDQWDKYNSILAYADDSGSVRSRTIPLSIYKKRGNVADDQQVGESRSVVLETNLSKASQQLLEAFSIEGQPISLDYILDTDTNVTWRTGSGKVISNGKGTLTFEEEGQTVSGTIEFDTEGNPTEPTKAFLKAHRFWDDYHEYRAVKPAYPGEIINYSQAEVERLQQEIAKQEQIAEQYQALIEAIGDRDTEDTFAHTISVATDLVNDALSKKIFQLAEFIKDDPDYARRYPIAAGAFGNENLSRFVKDTDRISIEDLLMGAMLLGDQELISKLSAHTAKVIAKLQAQVNVDDLSILQYSRDVDKPVSLRDKNRVSTYVKDFTTGDGIKYVLRSKAEEFRRLGEDLPYNPRQVASGAKSYAVPSVTS